jgi:hypothetical protein
MAGAASAKATTLDYCSSAGSRIISSLKDSAELRGLP